VNCLLVRDRLVERSLGALSLEDGAAVDRHVAWCAACRKESAELDRAAATLALTLAPEAPAPELEDRVVGAVSATAAGDRGEEQRPPRRGRLAAASVIAAMIAISALGWGSAMAGRAERFRERATVAERQEEAFSTFKSILIGRAVFAQPENRAYLGILAPTSERAGGGSALTLVSPSITDFAMVTVSGLPPNDHGALPYRVWIVDGSTGERFQVGKPIQELDADGSANRVENFADLSAFRTVRVTDASGDVVLSGDVMTEAVVASPTP